MNSFVKRAALATTICAALVAPVAVGSAAMAAPVSAAAQAADARFSAEVVQSFVPGERVTVSGTAAPGSDIHLMYMPGSPDAKTVADASGSWSVVSTDTADARFSVVATDGSADARITMLPTHEAGDEVPIKVDPIRFAPGERLYVSGTAAPNAVLVISGIPVSTIGGVPNTLVGARAGADGRFSAGGVTSPADVDSFDVTFHIGGQRVTETAVSTESADKVLAVTSPEMGAVVTNSVNQVTFTGRSSLGGTVRVETTGGRVLAKAEVNPSTGTWALRGEIAYDLMYTVNVVAEGADGTIHTVQHQVKVVKPSA